jgi:hypothetical protein
MKPTASTGRRFEFQKRGQQFTRTHNETLSVAAMCVKMSCPHGRIRCLRNITERRLRRPQPAERRAKSSVLIHNTGWVKSPFNSKLQQSLISQYFYKVRPSKDHRSVDLIFDALPFGCSWYVEASDAIDYAKHRSCSHDAPVSI